MDFSISTNFIMGMMVGIEFVTDEEESARHMAIDLFILRILFSVYHHE